MTNTILDRALQYASMGWYVVPVYRAGRKIPCTKHGLLDGSIDADVIKSWWMEWPDANVAIVAYMSNLVVFDADTSEAVSVMEKMLSNNNITTLVSKTSRGAHFIFNLVLPENMKVVGKLDYLPGIDIKYRGYFVAPPSIHSSGVEYDWVGEFIPPINIPNFLLDDITYSRNITGEPVEVTLTDSSTAYGLAALNNQIDEILNSDKGERNNVLFLASTSIGNLVAGGQLNEDESFEALKSAGLSIGLCSQEVISTIKSGMKTGLLSPKVPKDTISLSIESKKDVDVFGDYLRNYPSTIWEYYFSNLLHFNNSNIILNDEDKKIIPYYFNKKPVGFITLCDDNTFKYSSNFLENVSGISGDIYNNDTVYICTDISDMLVLESLGYSPICIFGDRLIPRHLSGLVFNKIILVPKSNMQLGAYYSVANMFAKDVSVVYTNLSGYNAISEIGDKSIVNNLLSNTKNLKQALSKSVSVKMRKSSFL